MMEDSIKYKVVVIGGDHYNTYGIVRSLGEQGINSNVIIMSPKRRESFVLMSKYVEEGKVCMTNKEILSYLTTRFNDSTTNIVICCSDEAEEVVLSHYDDLSKLFILPVCRDPGETTRLMNKKYIVELAEKYGITVPTSWLVADRHVPDGIIYPCITKPLTSIGGHKSDIVVCHSYEDLWNVVNDSSHCSDYVVQQYVEYEKEISILGAILADGSVVFSGCIDKLRTCMVGTSSFAVMVDNLLLGENVTKLRALLVDTGYRGLFSAEFLKRGDNYYFLEVNFRNDGNTYVATASGLNLPYIYVTSCIGKKVEISVSQYPCFFMLEIEDFRKRKKNGVSFKQWHTDLRKANCCLVYNQEDIRPFRKKVWITIVSYFNILFIALRKVGLVK
jgi:predicted ATP-grasp superfamily ATP-dependent carboligase